MRVVYSFLIAIVAAMIAEGAHAQENRLEEGRRGAGGKPPPYRAMFIATGCRGLILNVTLDGVTIKPTLALGGWVAFQPMHGAAMVMGDLVLLDNRNQSGHGKAARTAGLDITGVHNHLLRANARHLLYACLAGTATP